jgi:allophanate hydrolase subunit 1
MASFVQSHWFGRTYSEIPYRIFFIGFALGTPVLLKINLGALRWLERRLL